MAKRNEHTSKRVASRASATLRNPKATKWQKSVAASVLTQARDKKRKKELEGLVMPTYADLKQAAAALGLVEEICPGCYRTGVSRRPDAGSPTGVITERPCGQCDGSGRVWVLPRGALGIQDSDAELWSRWQAERRPAQSFPT